ncbi:unnamed protein product [Linum trigynum]|uniref:Polyprotein n=1 Tax=Linum trigynum TaxID=586398 RepID=A0AAV2F9C3_9ROSI
MENVAGAKKLVEGSTEAKQPRNCSKETSPAIIIKHRESDEQRDNLFHSRCEINGKIASLVIDGGSCANLISTYAVEKLELKTQKHPKPYHLTWLNEHGDVKVNKQAQIEFIIGKYRDTVLCDVVPMQNVHILLGRPWQFDRRVLHDGWENSYTFKHESRKIKLKPLSPDQVFDDLKQMEENRNEGKSVQAQLWVQRCAGFNFMSFRKLQKGVTELKPPIYNDPCFVTTKQSLNTVESVVVIEGSSHTVTTANTFKTIPRVRYETKLWPKELQLKGSKSKFLLQLCSATSIQSRREGQWDGTLESDLNLTTASELFYEASRSSLYHWIRSSCSTLQNPRSVPPPLQTVQHAKQTAELVGAVEEESSATNCAKMFVNTPRMISMEVISPIPAVTKNPILSEVPLKTKKYEQEIGELVEEIRVDSNTMEPIDEFVEFQGWCRCKETCTKTPGLKFPNYNLGSPDSGFELPDSGKFKISGGGKLANCNWSRMENNRRWVMGGNDYWEPDGAIGSGNLACGCLEEKHPIFGPSPEFEEPPESAKFWPETGKLAQSNLGSIEQNIFVGKVPWSPTNILAFESWGKSSRSRSNEASTFEWFEVRTSLGYHFCDPIWEDFVEKFDCRSKQALRAKLFEVGEPDMIQIGHFYKSQLLAKEAIKVGKKKGRIWPSQNPCSGYIFWRHGSLNWLGGNSILGVCFADKVFLFPMVCSVDSDDVIKVVFQGLKVATSKLENCQKMVKSGNCFVKPTLELNSRSMDLLQVQRLPQHKTRYVYVQMEGIG